jgi:molybdopterin synthase catalytic subunit
VFALTAEPIELDALIEAVSSPQHGAICTFLGVTRETTNGESRLVEALDYEAYAEMALADLRAIGEEARARFGPLEIAIVHRTGTVPLGEASVAIAVGSPHRAQGFDACEFAIDTLKVRTPIWKRERYRDGGGAWVANKEAVP